MKGAIIGDLAAWTWEHDKERFYKGLVADDARLSQYGLGVLAFYDCSRDDLYNPYFKEDVADFMRVNAPHAELDLWMREGLEHGFSYTVEELQRNRELAVRLMLVAQAAVLYGWETSSYGMTTSFASSLNITDDFKSLGIFSQVMYNLRQGMSKREAFAKVPDKVYMEEYLRPYYGQLQMKHHTPKNTAYLSAIISYAFLCFEKSWDFTSTIHNAMHCPDWMELHFVAMMTGALAECMYGSTNCMIKKKYGGDDVIPHQINLPGEIQESFKELLWDIEDYCEKKRVFFQKNSSRTNVERQYWTSFDMTGLPETVNAEFRRRLLKGYKPYEDARFGVYLDDGWFYVCRSFVLLARFQLKEIEEGTWKIVRIQKCTSEHSADSAMREIIDCIRNRWFRISEEQGPENLRYCKYYYGETDNPFEQRTPKAKFWHGEMMFVTNELDMSKWIQTAEKALRGMDERHKVKFLSYSKEQQAILIYISNLYAKWCPYDDQEWIERY